MGWVTGSRLVCPHGHRIPPDVSILGDGLVRCRRSHVSDRAAICGARMYVAAVADARGRAEPAYFVVEITGEEWALLETAAGARSVVEILELLGATLEAAA